MKTFTLKEACRQAGVTRRAVQGYESAGLVAAVGRNERGYLLYDEGALAQIKAIRFLQEVGFSVKEVAAFSQMDKDARLGALTAKRAELHCRADRLEELINELEKLIREYE